MRKPQLTAKFSSPRAICFGLDLQSSAGRCRTVLLRHSFFGDVSGDHDFCAVRKSQQAGTGASSGTRTWTISAPRKKMAPSPRMNADRAASPKQVCARQGKDDPCCSPTRVAAARRERPRQFPQQRPVQPKAMAAAHRDVLSHWTAALGVQSSDSTGLTVHVSPDSRWSLLALADEVEDAFQVVGLRK